MSEREVHGGIHKSCWHKSSLICDPFEASKGTEPRNSIVNHYQILIYENVVLSMLSSRTYRYLIDRMHRNSCLNAFITAPAHSMQVRAVSLPIHGVNKAVRVQNILVAMGWQWCLCKSSVLSPKIVLNTTTWIPHGWDKQQFLASEHKLLRIEERAKRGLDIRKYIFSIVVFQIVGAAPSP